jgi:hypothetical protein
MMCHLYGDIIKQEAVFVTFIAYLFVVHLPLCQWLSLYTASNGMAISKQLNEMDVERSLHGLILGLLSRRFPGRATKNNIKNSG